MSEEKNEPESKYEELMSQLVDRVKEFEKSVKTQVEEIEKKGKANENLAKEMEQTKSTIDALNQALEELRNERQYSVMETDETKSILEMAKEASEGKLEAFIKRGFHRGEIVINLGCGLFTPERKTLMEEKTTITSATVGSATSGILVPARVRDYVPAAQRRFTIRDLLPSRPVSTNAVEFPKENAFTNAASPQTEGSDKAESALTFTIGTAIVRTIAHWIPATAQVLDDWTQLERIIVNKLMYGLKLKEETELLMGDGLGVHLSGLITQATAYAGTYNVGSDTNLDRLRWAILEVEDDDEVCDFIVLHPKNWYTILGIKDEAGGANVGNYVAGNPVAFAGGEPTAIWGKKVVVTNSMTADKFLVGNSNMAEVFDRMQASLAISTEHSDYFIKNMVALRVEERIALAVYRTSAFVYGSF